VEEGKGSRGKGKGLSVGVSDESWLAITRRRLSSSFPLTLSLLPSPPWPPLFFHQVENGRGHRFDPRPQRGLGQWLEQG
jgi:hypothetical protein